MENNNILIAGIGGQGVNALSTLIQKLLLKKGLFCKGAIFKGGAQKRGAVYSMIRIFDTKEGMDQFSAIVPEKGLDLLIALEINEAMRYSKYCNSKTVMLVNSYNFPFYNKRFKEGENADQKELTQGLSEYFEKLILVDESAHSETLFGNAKMLNLLMGIQAIKAGYIPLELDAFLDESQQKMKIEYEDMMKLIEVCES